MKVFVYICRSSVQELCDEYLKFRYKILHNTELDWTMWLLSVLLWSHRPLRLCSLFLEFLLFRTGKGFFDVFWLTFHSKTTHPTGCLNFCYLFSISPFSVTFPCWIFLLFSFVLREFEFACWNISMMITLKLLSGCDVWFI